MIPPEVEEQLYLMMRSYTDHLQKLVTDGRLTLADVATILYQDSERLKKIAKSYATLAE